MLINFSSDARVVVSFTLSILQDEDYHSGIDIHQTITIGSPLHVYLVICQLVQALYLNISLSWASLNHFTH